MNDDIKLLCELQSLHDKEVEIKKAFKENNKTFSEDKKQFERMQTVLDKIVKELSEKRNLLQDEELKLSSLEENIKKYEKELFSNSSSNPKFLRELENKVNELKKLKDKSEEVVLTLMDEVDNLQNKLVTQEEILKKAGIELRVKESRFNEAQEETKKILDEINFRSKILREKIKLEYLEAFDRALLLGQGKAISIVLGSVCGICKANIPLNTLEKLKKEPNMLQYCENCGRILCINEQC